MGDGEDFAERQLSRDRFLRMAAVAGGERVYSVRGLNRGAGTGHACGSHGPATESRLRPARGGRSKRR